MYNYKTNVEVIINLKTQKGISNLSSDIADLSNSDISNLYKKLFPDYELISIEILEITKTN